MVARRETQQTVTVPLPDAEKKALAEYCARKHKVLKRLLGDLIVWFLAQPESVRQVATNEVPEGMEEAYAAALEELAAQVRAKAKGGKGR